MVTEMGQAPHRKLIGERPVAVSRTLRGVRFLVLLLLLFVTGLDERTLNVGQDSGEVTYEGEKTSTVPMMQKSWVKSGTTPGNAIFNLLYLNHNSPTIENPILNSH